MTGEQLTPKEQEGQALIAHRASEIRNQEIWDTKEARKREDKLVKDSLRRSSKDSLTPETEWVIELIAKTLEEMWYSEPVRPYKKMAKVLLALIKEAGWQTHEEVQGLVDAAIIMARLGYVKLADEIVCPFCGEADFDKIGLKHHLDNYCEGWRKVELEGTTCEPLL